MINSMAQATSKELSDSIELLVAYRDRLQKEVINVAKKLQMPQKKIDSTIKGNSELRQIEKVLEELLAARDRKEN